MKFLAEAQVAVLVTTLLLGLGTISTCAVVLGTTDDSRGYQVELEAERPEWINPAMGLVPLAVALLAWSGALGVYIVACLLTRILQDTTWVVSVRADVFLLSAFLVWGLIANICMTVAVGLSVNSRGMNAVQSLAADQAGTAAAVFTWIILCILTIWLAVEITYIKMEYGRLAAVWSQSLRVLTPERVRRGDGVNLADPPEKNSRARQVTTPPATYTIPQLPSKARPASRPVVRDEARHAVRERDASDEAYEAERAARRARREQRRRRRERREERRAIRAVREMEEREACEAVEAAEAAEAAAAAEDAAADIGAHDHRNGEHCPTCGSHSVHWKPAKAAPTSPLHPEVAASRTTNYEGLPAMNAVAGPSRRGGRDGGEDGAGGGAGTGAGAGVEAGAGSQSKRPDKGKRPATRSVSPPMPAPPPAGPTAGPGPSTMRKIGSGESPPLPPLPIESTPSHISPVSPHIEPLVLPPIGFSLFSSESHESPFRRPSPETRGNAEASGSNSQAAAHLDYMDYYNDRLSQPTLKSLKSLKSSKGECPISPEHKRKA